MSNQLTNTFKVVFYDTEERRLDSQIITTPVPMNPDNLLNWISIAIPEWDGKIYEIVFEGGVIQVSPFGNWV